MEKKRKNPGPVNQLEIVGAGQQTSMGSTTSERERRSKRFKSSSVTNICVLCGSVCRTINKQKYISYLQFAKSCGPRNY